MNRSTERAYRTFNKPQNKNDLKPMTKLVLRMFTKEKTPASRKVDDLICKPT